MSESSDGTAWRVTTAVVVVAAVVLAVVAFLAWRFFLRVPPGAKPYLPQHPTTAVGWAATIPGVGVVRLVGITDIADSTPKWWSPDGTPLQSTFPLGTADAAAAQSASSGKSGQCRVFSFEFVKGVPDDIGMSCILGLDGSRFSSLSFHQDPPRDKFASASFLRGGFGSTDDLYLAVASGRKQSIATQNLPKGKVITKSKWSPVTIARHTIRSATEFLVGVPDDLNDGKLTLSARDAAGRPVQCDSAGSTSEYVWVRVGSEKIGRERRTYAFHVHQADIKKVASIELSWIPFRWIVFKNVALEPR